MEYQWISIDMHFTILCKLKGTIQKKYFLLVTQKQFRTSGDGWDFVDLLQQLMGRYHERPQIYTKYPLRFPVFWKRRAAGNKSGGRCSSCSLLFCFSRYGAFALERWAMYVFLAAVWSWTVRDDSKADTSVVRRKRPPPCLAAREISAATRWRSNNFKYRPMEPKLFTKQCNAMQWTSYKISPCPPTTRPGLAFLSPAYIFAHRWAQKVRWPHNSRLRWRPRILPWCFGLKINIGYNQKS